MINSAILLIERVYENKKSASLRYWRLTLFYVLLDYYRNKVTFGNCPLLMLTKVKNGGIVAFVTSAGTLDKRDETTRQMLADKADFIGAIRLPGGKNGAFKDNAGTEVTTDIIFLKKHEGKSVAEMSDIPDWVHIGETADGLPINKYFEQHPDMVLGTVVEGNKLYGSGTMVIS